jgi:hypothetical protein
MISLTNILSAFVIIGSVLAVSQNPYAFYDLFVYSSMLLYNSFNITQWTILLTMFLLSSLVYPLLAAATPTKFRYDGRHFVAQAGDTPFTQGNTTASASPLGTTASAVPGGRGDESNQSSNTGVSHQTKTSLQTQVAPDLNEDILLPNYVETKPYSNPMYVGQFPFASTRVVGDSIAYITNDQLFANNNFKRLFADFRFAKYDIRYTINITGNVAATGLLMAATIPIPQHPPGTIGAQDPTTIPVWTNNYDRVLASNHVILDISQDVVCKLDASFTCYKPYQSTFDYSNDQPWNALYVIVLSPYLPATSQTSNINIEIYATICNIEHIETAPYNAQSLLSIGETTNISQNMGDIKDSNLPVNVTGDSITASVPDSFGLDKPADPRNAPTSMLRMAYQKLAAWADVLDVWKVSPTPAVLSIATTPISSDIRVEVDEMSMDFFRGRWFSPQPVSYAPYTITTSTATGALVGSIPMTPTPYNTGDFSTNFSPSSNTDWSQWLVSFFRYWRGSFKYRIVIASNAMKRGKILVCVNYGSSIMPSNATTTGSLDPRSLHHVIIDLSNGDRFVDITVPYKSVFEYLRTPNLIAKGTMPFNECSLGTLGIYLISPLQVNNTTSTTVNINVLQAFGPDFELYDPLTTNSGIGFAQSKLTISDAVTPFRTSGYMEPFRNLRQLLTTRPLTVGNYPMLYNASSTNNFGTMPIMIPIHPSVLGATHDLWSGIVNMYSGMRGGYRLLLRFSNINHSTTVKVSYHECNLTLNGNETPTPMITGGVEYWDPSLYNGLDSSVLNGQLYSGGPQNVNLPQMSFLNGTINPVSVNQIPQGDAYALRSYGTPIRQTIVLDPYSQPEVVLEVPDPSPMYRTQQTTTVSTAAIPYNFAGGGKYNPYFDRNLGFLCITASDPAALNPNIPSVSDIAGTVEVTLLAADDFKAFWYNGGPTYTYPYCVGYNVNTSTPTYNYFNPNSK